ncbi:hypothetical protein K2X33_03795 [bacterium]|nr:hypothetical protein [bacterium]
MRISVQPFALALLLFSAPCFAAGSFSIRGIVSACVGAIVQYVPGLGSSPAKVPAKPRERGETPVPVSQRIADVAASFRQGIEPKWFQLSNLSLAIPILGNRARDPELAAQLLPLIQELERALSGDNVAFAEMSPHSRAALEVHIDKLRAGMVAASADRKAGIAALVEEALRTDRGIRALLGDMKASAEELEPSFAKIRGALLGADAKPAGRAADLLTILAPQHPEAFAKGFMDTVLDLVEVQARSRIDINRVTLLRFVWPHTFEQVQRVGRQMSAAPWIEEELKAILWGLSHAPESLHSEAASWIIANQGIAPQREFFEAVGRLRCQGSAAFLENHLRESQIDRAYALAAYMGQGQYCDLARMETGIPASHPLSMIEIHEAKQFVSLKQTLFREAVVAEAGEWLERQENLASRRISGGS